REIAKVKNKLSVLSTRTKGPKGNVLTTDRIVDEYGQTIEKGEPFETAADIKARRGDGDGKGAFKSADASEIRRQATQMFGGFYDPATGQFSGLDREKAAKVQALIEEAELIYREGGVGHGEAIAQAARKLGINISNVRDLSLNDPLGLRGSNPFVQ
ncbi:MAG: hypothetical protein MJA83_08510, partial [Gammaproteobacteria bacterium]|nr:hypothetical protein [Gammaproteobacteria bacterium]